MIHPVALSVIRDDTDETRLLRCKPSAGSPIAIQEPGVIGPKDLLLRQFRCESWSEGNRARPVIQTWKRITRVIVTRLRTVAPRGIISPEKGMRIEALAVAWLLLLTSCSTGSGPVAVQDSATTTTATATTTPTPIASSSQCDLGAARDLYNRFFSALNAKDAGAIDGMFASQIPIEFSITPDILSAAQTSISRAVDTQAQTFDHNGISFVVSSTEGMTFAWVPPSPATYVDSNPGTAGRLMIAISPLDWHAEGPPLLARGKTRVNGGGKIAIDCETGLFSKVRLGPLSFD